MLALQLIYFITFSLKKTKKDFQDFVPEFLLYFFSY